MLKPKNRVHNEARKRGEVEVEDLIEVDHLSVLITLLVTLAAVGAVWIHFGR
jgi:hypothetical protein